MLKHCVHHMGWLQLGNINLGSYPFPLWLTVTVVEKMWAKVAMVLVLITGCTLIEADLGS
jgi:hypothetical protein